jgi:hypothetical protein
MPSKVNHPSYALFISSTERRHSIRFIEYMTEKALDAATEEAVNVTTCYYHWRHIAANKDRTVV